MQILEIEKCRKYGFLCQNSCVIQKNVVTLQRNYTIRYGEYALNSVVNGTILTYNG